MTPMLIVAVVLAVLVLIVIARTAVVVPQQGAYVVERLGKYAGTLQAGFHLLVPFFDVIRYRHSLKENAVDIPEQICITRDNVQVHVDGVLYLKVLNPERASYGAADYLFAISQLAQTTLRSEIGKIDLDRTFEERTHINVAVVNELDKASEPWGIKVLRYEIKNITPPRDVLAAMEKQMRAEREKRAVILASEGVRDAVVEVAGGRIAAIRAATSASNTSAEDLGDLWLLPGLVDALSHNARHGRPDVRMFEIGTRFSARGETRGAAFAWMGLGTPDHWSGLRRPVDFSDIKGVVEFANTRGLLAVGYTASLYENNIPTVGESDILRGREMTWMRIERYWDDAEGHEAASPRFVPMLCQHCANAPCEPVCPVYASYHNPDGLNGQVYNRCVGTRYCGNNCPYAVRVFNFYDHEHSWPHPLNYQLSPDITVRSRGVMEKCTFCIQRIRRTKEEARAEGRLIRDGEVQPACVQTCPPEALVFGNMADPESRVSRLSRSPRRFKLLEQLGTHPSINYLKGGGREHV